MMIQKIDNYELFEWYRIVLIYGTGFEDQELKHIMQLKDYAINLYEKGVNFCVCMTQSDTKILPEGVTEENELQFYINTFEGTINPMYVIKLINDYLELINDQI